MLQWALGFFLVALFAAFLGFGGIALGVARILFFLFLTLFFAALLGHVARRT